MAVYARVKEGIVQEVIGPLLDGSGIEYPIEERFAPDFVEQMIDVTAYNPCPESGWSYVENIFSPPTAPILSVAEIIARNTAARDSFMDIATKAIQPLQDAVDLGDPGKDEKAMLVKWKEFRRDTNRIDLSLESPSWPEMPV